MAKVKIQGHASGTGVLTVTAPNTSSDRTITLPDSTGTILDENSSLPAANLTGTVADARISTLTASKLTGALPDISGASLTSLPAASAVAFPATQVASADANTLDDYEEGTWTPVANGGSSYTNQVGWYVKIGRYVYIEFYIRGFTATAVSSIITALPFTAGSVSPPSPSYGACFPTHNNWTNCSGGGGYIKHAMTEIKFHNVGTITVSTANAVNPAYCIGFGSYHTDD